MFEGNIPLNDPGKTYNKEYVCNTLNNYLNEFARIRATSKQKQHIREIFNFLLTCRDFLDDEPKLKEAVREKIEYFACHDDFRLEIYYYAFFKEDLLPKKYLIDKYNEKMDQT